VTPHYEDINIRILTPLWLGGVDGDSEVDRESGVVGSLRFWARVFGMSKDDIKKLFGDTGTRKQFRIELHGLKGLVTLDTDDLPRPTSNEERKELVLIRDKKVLFQTEPFRIRIIGEADPTGQIRNLLGSLATYGGLGPKTQMGFGQIELVSPPTSVWTPRPESHHFRHEITVNREKAKNWPKDTIYVMEGVHIRNAVLRPAIRALHLDELEIHLFGKPGSTSRLHVSHPFRSRPGDDYRIRIWGEAREEVGRILGAIKGALKQYE